LFGSMNTEHYISNV